MFELAKLFLKMGCVSFGGPIAAMAMLEEEFARKRKWITEQHFSEIYAVLKLFPGPLSTQMAIYLGRTRGRWGGIVSGLSYILPAFVLLLCLSFIYVKSGGVGQGSRFLGFQLGALVVILQSTVNMAKPYRKRLQAWLVCAGAFALVYPFPRYEPLVLVGFGILGAFLARRSIQAKKSLGTPRSVGLGIVGVGAGVTAAKTTLLGKLFWVCFKAGAFVFGSGLAIVPLLEGDAVRHHHWLTHQQFMDGLALGQVTPGPVVITATFIGFVVAAFPGAIVATFAIFLPAFINIHVILPRVWARISKSPYAKPFTEFAIPAVIGAIFATTFRLAVVSLISPAAWGIFVGGLLLAFFTRAPGWALIVGSGLVGLLV